MSVLPTVIPFARIMSLFLMKGVWNAEAVVFRVIKMPLTGFIPEEASVSVTNLVKKEKEYSWK